MVKEITAAERLTSLQARIKQVETQKIGAEKEHEMLRKSHTELLDELKQYGIESVNDLPAMIDSLTQEIDTLLTEAEEVVTNAEQQIKTTV